MSIGVVFSKELVELTSLIPKISGRSEMLAMLMDAFLLTEKFEIIEPNEICGIQLAEFHSKDYIETLESYPENAKDDGLKHFGLEYDCPPFPKMFRTVCAIGGSSITAADEIGQGYFKIIINWFGGWHHGQPEKAEGFCYVNDCVLAIRQLRNYFTRVLYVDLDLHHGNGVETAFYQSNTVLTYSVHKYESGFYPGTGSVECVGEGRGRGYSVNIPLKDGATDNTLNKVLERTLGKVVEKFKPDAIVCQCGADGISGDPHQAFNYTAKGLSAAVSRVISYDRPTLLLGGGGYNHANVARTWTTITGELLGIDLTKEDVPAHKHFTQYGPGFEMSIKASNMRNDNDSLYLESVINTVINNIGMIK